MGPNGAGKTTAVGVLATLVHPTGGEAFVAGRSVTADPLGVRQCIGVVFHYTFIAVGQVAFLIPFTAMFSGINVVVDTEFGVTREMLVAPVRRAAIPLANAAAVLMVSFVQVAIIVGLGWLRGPHFHTSVTRMPWFLIATALLCLTIYGLAETLALRIGRQEAYGPLIPVIGVTPYSSPAPSIQSRCCRPASSGWIPAALDPRRRAHALRAHGRHQSSPRRHLAPWK